MNSEYKKQWVDALRSGRYEQVKEYLHTSSGFCCLGVYCDIRNPDGWTEEYHKELDETYYYQDGEDQTLPWELKEEVGPGNQEVLMSMNDVGQSFSEIADWIEANL